MQCSRGDSFQEEGGVSDFAEADRDAAEARKDFWSMSGELFIYRHHVMPREQWYVPKESSFPMPSKYMDVVRQIKTNPDNLEESSTDDLWNTFDGQTSLRKEVRIHEIPNPEQASTTSVFVRGWQIDQNTSHIETRNGSARSVVIYF